MALDVRGLTPLLQVYDMPDSIRFYRDLLGFEVVSTFAIAEEKATSLGCASGSEMLN